MGKRYTAKIGHADRPTANGNVYPRAVWEANIARLLPMCKAGRVGGTIDHLDGPAKLADRAILWRDFRIDADGAVYGTLELVAGHPKGEALAALLEAGAAVGFSTVGDGFRRPATAEDRRRYGEGAESVMGDGFAISGIDAVADPAVADAFIRESRQRAAGALPSVQALAHLRRRPAVKAAGGELAAIVAGLAAGLGRRR